MVYGVIIAEENLADHRRLEARKHATESIVDGTMWMIYLKKDLGIKALREKGIRSPMLEIGIKKCDIREIARECGLSIYYKPPNHVLPQGSQEEQKLRWKNFERLKILR